jgi:hypothetical protein
LRWLQDIHLCDKERIELFKAKEYFKLNDLKIENLADLFWANSNDKEKKMRDTIDNLKDKFSDPFNPKDLSDPKEGVAGLAKAIYIFCRILN